LRVNERVSAPRVRLVLENGEQAGIVTREEALARAAEAGLDLVEVAPNANPPVCKLMDYGKYKYRLKKKQHQSKVKQHTATVKEIRLRPKTDRHDVEIKLKRVREFLAKRHKVLVSMMFRGREMAHIELGKEMLESIAKELEDVAKVEKPPTMERYRMHMMLAPKQH